jgi:DNA-binding MarR family transcriptional regulator
MSKPTLWVPEHLVDITTYQAGVMQAKSFRNLKKYFEQCLSAYGLTSMQWFIAGTVYDRGSAGIPMTSLAKELGITLPSLLGALEVLESKGMVSKTSNSDDNRVKIITATLTFAKQCPMIEDELRQKFRDTLYAKLTIKELTTYVRVLYKIAGLR